MSDITTMSNMSRMSRSMRAKSASRLFSESTRHTYNYQVPNVDSTHMPLWRFPLRHATDVKRLNDTPVHLKPDLEALLKETKYVPNDAPDVLSRGPSYSKFKIPYEMICHKRYQDAVKAYDAQLEREIRKNIDFQSTAADALYYMRCVAYSTFWPPLHTMKEANYTRKNFFQLTGKEKARFDFIMRNDIC